MKNCAKDAVLLKEVTFQDKIYHLQDKYAEPYEDILYYTEGKDSRNK